MPSEEIARESSCFDVRESAAAAVDDAVAYTLYHSKVNGQVGTGPLSSV